MEWRSCNFTSVTKNVVRQTARLHNSCASLKRVSRVSSTATISARSYTKGEALVAHVHIVPIDCVASGANALAIECLHRIEWTSRQQSPRRSSTCARIECLHDPLDCPCSHHADQLRCRCCECVGRRLSPPNRVGHSTPTATVIVGMCFNRRPYESCRVQPHTMS